MISDNNAFVTANFKRQVNIPIVLLTSYLIFVFNILNNMQGTLLKSLDSFLPEMKFNFFVKPTKRKPKTPSSIFGFVCNKNKIAYIVTQLQFTEYIMSHIVEKIYFGDVADISTFICLKEDYII